MLVSTNKSDGEELNLLFKVEKCLKRKLDWQSKLLVKEIEMINYYLFLTSEPLIYLVNLSGEK